MTIVGDVAIKPDVPLEVAATKLGTALAVAFAPETTGRYEEYPAYVAEALGLHLALLGVPDPAHDIRSERTPEYRLQIVSEKSTGGPVVNVSAFIAEVIRQNSDLGCSALV